MSGFRGFPKEMLTFLDELEANNEKQWFESHRDEYEQYIKLPSCQFVESMGDMLKDLSPDVNAIAKINKSLFKIHRDVRFGKDKRPYKTTVGIWFWEGTGKRMEHSGYYFHLEKRKVMLGVGLYRFPKELLELYRKAVAADDSGKELSQICQRLEEKGYEIGMRHYKRVPRGFAADHPRADLLKYNGLTAMVEFKTDKAFHSAAFLEKAYSRYSEMKPLHDWLMGELF